MKAYDIFALACSHISQEPEESASLAALSPALLSTLVEECLATENIIRRHARQPELAEAPAVVDLEMDIPYQPALCRVSLVYGLASQFFVDDDNTVMAQDYRARYVTSLQDLERRFRPAIRWPGWRRRA